MLVVCIVLTVALFCLALKHLHFIWQIKNVNNQVEFMNTHKTNKIVFGEYSRGCITDLINNINALSKQCSVLKSQCMTNDNNIKETITNISHDIRTPLTSLSGYFQLMCQCDDISERKKYEKTIKQQIDTVEKMLEELFTYAKLLNESYEIALTKCQINQILRDAIFGFYYDFKKANIVPEVTIPEKPIYIVANDMALKRVFQNVLKNMMEHGRQYVGVTMQETNEEVKIIFFNDISEGDVIDTSRIFERFYKADTARHSSSTGLGLAIVKELLNKMNSSIFATVNGSRFEIVIKLIKGN